MSHDVLHYLCSFAGGGMIGFGCRMTIDDRRASFVAMVVGCTVWTLALALA